MPASPRGRTVSPTYAQTVCQLEYAKPEQRQGPFQPDPEYQAEGDRVAKLCRRTNQNALCRVPRADTQEWQGTLGVDVYSMTLNTLGARRNA